MYASSHTWIMFGGGWNAWTPAPPKNAYEFNPTLAPHRPHRCSGSMDHGRVVLATRGSHTLHTSSDEPQTLPPCPSPPLMLERLAC